MKYFSEINDTGQFVYENSKPATIVIKFSRNYQLRFCPHPSQGRTLSLLSLPPTALKKIALPKEGKKNFALVGPPQPSLATPLENYPPLEI